MLWRMVQISFANASLSLSPPPSPLLCSPPHPHHSNSSMEEKQASLLVLLTDILRVDECAGLTAQCAYLIGAAPLSH